MHETHLSEGKQEVGNIAESDSITNSHENCTHFLSQRCCCRASFDIHMFGCDKCEWMCVTVHVSVSHVRSTGMFEIEENCTKEINVIELIVFLVGKKRRHGTNIFVFFVSYSISVTCEILNKSNSLHVQCLFRFVSF